MKPLSLHQQHASPDYFSWWFYARIWLRKARALAFSSGRNQFGAAMRGFAGAFLYF
jgi:hypothetical protein